MSDNEIVQEFLVESYENLDRLDRELVSLEKNPGDTETLASIFRTIHTIKGTCGFLGFSKLEAVAHVGENLLSKLRDGVVHLNPHSTTALLSMFDAVRQMLASIEASGQEGERNDAALIAALTALLRTEPAAPAAPAKPAPKSGAAAPPPPKAEVEAMPKLDMPHIDVTNMGELLIERTAASFSDVTSAVTKQAKGDPRHVGEILVEDGTVKAADVVDALHAQRAARGQASVSDSTIRVDVALLDKLMNLVGELVLARNQILQFSNLSENAGIVAPSQRLNLITTELQEGVMKTRMQPIGNLWSKLPRTVRDLALSCGKEIEIEMQGAETELDKTILEAIKDPLTQVMQHLDDINEVGRGIAVAFVATLYGVGIANLVLLPAAGKLRIRILEEQVIRQMMLEGIIAIMEGMNPRMIEAKLLSYWGEMPPEFKEEGGMAA